MTPPSIGIRHVKGTEAAAHSLLNQAYMAASSIYDIDDRHVVVYGDSMYNNFVLEQIILSDFKTALEHHDFQLYFQPKYNIASGKTIGAKPLSDGTILQPDSSPPARVHTHTGTV